VDCLAAAAVILREVGILQANLNQAPVFEEISQTLLTNEKQGQIYNKYKLSTDKSQACLAFRM
jgi:hypothetical protein